MSPRAAMILLFLCFSQIAGATQPASRYQIFCEANADFVGTVEYAETKDCKLCALVKETMLSLKVKVNEVIRNQLADVHEGDIILTNIVVRNDPPKMIGGRPS